MQSTWSDDDLNDKIDDEDFIGGLFTYDDVLK